MLNSRTWLLLILLIPMQAVRMYLVLSGCLQDYENVSFLDGHDCTRLRVCKLALDCTKLYNAAVSS